MRILQVNKYHYPRGGADKYFLDLIQAQEKAGHKVAVFSMNHPKNIPSPWSSYFVSRISFNNPKFKDKLKTPIRVLYSLEAAKKFTKLINNFKPDIIHIHNIYHQISPSILNIAKRHKIPVVMHLHDYKLICANHTLFNKGLVCERCRPNKYYQCLKNRCVKNSFSASALVSMEMYLHHSILKIYKNNVDYFIAPSKFMKETIIKFAYPAEKIKVIYNPYNLKLSQALKQKNNYSDSNYLLYFGRLSPEKGIETLIQAAALSNKKTKIVGEGIEGTRLKKLAKKLKAPVEFLGFKANLELQLLILNAKAIIIPSIWYENMPLNLLEALSLGKIVVASNIGGIPEIITNEKNGLLFTPNSVQDLLRQIKHLDNIDQIMMSREAKNTAANFSPQKNLEEVMELYKNLIK